MKQFYNVLICCVCTMIMMSGFAFGEDKGDFSTSPMENDGKKWRIGYYEGGAYVDYQQIFVATIQEFMKLGWMEKTEPPEKLLEGEETASLWQWLSESVKSKYVHFVKDGHYSANWDENLRKEISKQIVDRLNVKQDIDLMIAAGTWAGQDLATNAHHTPTIVISSSDAISAGIIKSIEDSGYDHIHATIAPFRNERQIRIFHDIIGFQKLGVAYENTVAGRSIAAISKIEDVSKEHGFDLVRCYTIDDVPDRKIAEESVRKCFRELSKEAEAIYVTQQNGINKNNISDIVEIAIDNKIPTFSQAGAAEVRNGFLMSISQAGYKYVGKFQAEIIAKILNGAKPRSLNQIFEDPPKIAINLKTAEAIGYDPPVDVLGAADEIYQDIHHPK